MIKKISAMAADIDGTLTTKGGNLLPLTKLAIQRLHKEGVKFGIASGRPLDDRTKNRAEEWGLGFAFDMMIGMNGGDLWTSEMKEIKHYNLLGTDTMKEIMQWLVYLNVNAISYIHGYDEIWCLSMDPFMEDSIRRNHSHVEIVSPEKFCSVPTGKIEVHYAPERETEINRVIAEHRSKEWAAVKTYTGTVEFQDPRLNKGTALREYSAVSGIPMNEIIAFGDMNNDLGMLKEAGWGVCLSNGCQACRKAADAVTEHTVEDDGVGHYLEDHWFSQK
jgi:Cof subfamily protein (haloacid dehalogenase superfamily)